LTPHHPQHTRSMAHGGANGSHDTNMASEITCPPPHTSRTPPNLGGKVGGALREIWSEGHTHTDTPTHVATFGKPRDVLLTIRSRRSIMPMWLLKKHAHGSKSPMVPHPTRALPVVTHAPLSMAL
jgi:hypothetical protein